VAGRDQLVARVRTDIALARALARAELAAAQAHLSATQARLTQVRAAAAQVPQRLRASRDQRLAAAREQHLVHAVELAGHAAQAAQGYVTGPAGLPWPLWVVDSGAPGSQASEALAAGEPAPGPLPRIPTARTPVDDALREDERVDVSPAATPRRDAPDDVAPPAGGPWADWAPHTPRVHPATDPLAATEPPAVMDAESPSAMWDAQSSQAVVEAGSGWLAVAAGPARAAIDAGAAASRVLERRRGRTARAQPLRVGAVPLGDVRVPAFLPFLDHAHVRVDGHGAPGTGPDAVIGSLLLRALADTHPGQVRVYGYDPERLGGGLAGFAPLAPAGLLRLVGPGGLGALLDELVDHIRRINETVLAGEYHSLAELAAAGRRPEPWRVAVLLRESASAELSRHEQAQLDRVLRTGVACGVHLVLHGFPGPELATVRDVSVVDGVASVPGYPHLPVAVEAPPAPLVTSVCRALAQEALAGPAPIDATTLLPEEYWTESSADGLTTALGEGADGRPALVTLGDFPPHALLGGPSGTGKTNLIFAWLAGLTARYSPDELELYLLDFKEGVSFARFAPGQRDPSWLPHVRLVGINANTDREFGLALLRHLAGVLRQRADAAKQAEVTTLAELRADDPDGRWPRIVAVVDEFQVLLAGRDALAAEAVTLLEDLSRRGRSQGIHLVLASQDLSGIEALWGRSGLVAQFTLRIALPKARRVLAEANGAADTVPRYHAVVNADSGAPEANQIVRIPAASERPLWTRLQGRLWRQRPAGSLPPRLFDGDAVPRLADAEDYPVTPATEAPSDPVALLGAAIDVRARSARLRLSRAPGRNLAVLGTQVDEACSVLHAAAASLARAYPPGAARFSLACLDDDASGAAAALHALLPADTLVYDRETLPDLLAATAATLRPGTVHAPHFLVLYAVDAAAGTLAAERSGGSGHANLRRILTVGPEQHTHVLGWWRSVGRLRDDLGGAGARLDAIGAWLALDVHGAELAPLYPHPGGPDWHPRPWRGLYFDRTVHRTAEVVIPYG
jgi:DNA segregation ATPase FtsK/SpoIIIE, S-DNA-T family